MKTKLILAAAVAALSFGAAVAQAAPGSLAEIKGGYSWNYIPQDPVRIQIPSDPVRIQKSARRR